MVFIVGLVIETEDLPYAQWVKISVVKIRSEMKSPDTEGDTRWM